MPEPLTGNTTSAAAEANLAPAQSTEQYTRLFISPLTPDSLHIILPPAQQTALVAPPYYGAPQTFPEHPFCYLELPVELATKLRKKLHGTTLKGQKMRVEDARGGRKRKAEERQDTASFGKRTRRSGKNEDGVLKGVELPQGRKVKRGWEEGWDGADTSMANYKRSGKKKAQPKDLEEKPEADAHEKKEDSIEAKMVFRTSVPPNKEADAADVPEKSKGHKKSKKSKSSSTEVKEFEKSEKVPTFLRSDTNEKAPRTTFEDGKGWVDESGNVVEEANESGRSSRRKKRKSKQESPPAAEPKESPDKANGLAPSAIEDAPSGQADKSPTPQIAVDSTATIDETAADIDGSAEPAEPKPSALESLFKRPSSKSKSKRPEPIKTFSFFDNEENDPTNDQDHATPDPDEPLHSAHETTQAPTSAPMNLRKKTTRLSSLQIPPQTPFTRRDLDARGLRSAAPTPDTAAIGKRMRPPWMARSQTRSLSRDPDERSRSGSQPSSQPLSQLQESEEIDAIASKENEETEEAKEEEKPVKKEVKKVKRESGENGEKEQTEFEKQFYEQRGDLNRAWKQQVREAKKSAKRASRRGKA